MVFKYQHIILTFKDVFVLFRNLKCNYKHGVWFFASIIFAKQNEKIFPSDALYGAVIPGSKGENEERRMDTSI